MTELETAELLAWLAKRDVTMFTRTDHPDGTISFKWMVDVTTAGRMTAEELAAVLRAGSSRRHDEPKEPEPERLG